MSEESTDGLLPARRSKRSSKRKSVGRRVVPPGLTDPEMPSKKAIETVNSLSLKQHPDLVAAIENLIITQGYRTVPDAIRHLLYVAVSATPIDGEFRAAMTSVRGQMLRYVTIAMWGHLKQLENDFVKDWKQADGHAFVEREIARVRGEVPPRCIACGHEENRAHT